MSDPKAYSNSIIEQVASLRDFYCKETGRVPNIVHFPREMLPAWHKEIGIPNGEPETIYGLRVKMTDAICLAVERED